MPRSGTSLAEQIISTHENVYGGGELYFLAKFFFQKLDNENKLKEDLSDELIKFQKNI